MNVCADCFYYSRTRFGAICSYDGTYNPVRVECPNFKPRENAEEETKASIEFTKLVVSLIDRLVQISPRIEKIEDEELRGELLEVCVAAKQIRKMLG